MRWLTFSNSASISSNERSRRDESDAATPDYKLGEIYGHGPVHRHPIIENKGNEVTC